MLTLVGPLDENQLASATSSALLARKRLGKLPPSMEGIIEEESNQKLKEWESTLTELLNKVACHLQDLVVADIIKQCFEGGALEKPEGGWSNDEIQNDKLLHQMTTGLRRLEELQPKDGEGPEPQNMKSFAFFICLPTCYAML